MRRTLYAVVGGVVGALLELLGDIATDWLRARAFETIVISWTWLAGFIIAGGLLGFWLGADVTAPEQRHRDGVVVTRLKAMWSRFTLKGQRASVSDVTAVGSTIEIDTRK